MLLLGGASTRAEDRVYREGRLAITLSEDALTLSVRAEEVPRREIFRVLDVTFGVTVRPLSSSSRGDEDLTVDLAARPLQQALQQLLPEGTPFVIRVAREHPSASALARRRRARERTEASPSASVADARRRASAPP